MRRLVTMQAIFCAPSNTKPASALGPAVRGLTSMAATGISMLNFRPAVCRTNHRPANALINDGQSEPICGNTKRSAKLHMVNARPATAADEPLADIARSESNSAAWTDRKSPCGIGRMGSIDHRLSRQHLEKESRWNFCSPTLLSPLHTVVTTPAWRSSGAHDSATTERPGQWATSVKQWRE